MGGGSGAGDWGAGSLAGGRSTLGASSGEKSNSLRGMAVCSMVGCQVKRAERFSRILVQSASGACASRDFNETARRKENVCDRPTVALVPRPACPCVQPRPFHSMKTLKSYFNAENITTFVIVVLAVIVASQIGPMVLGWFNKAKSRVTGS